MSRILYKYLNIEGAEWMLGMKKGRKYPNLQFTNPFKMNDPFDCDKNLLDYSDIPDSMTHGWIPKEWLRDKEINDAHILPSPPPICNCKCAQPANVIFTQNTYATDRQI